MRNLYNNCRLVPDYSVMRYNQINDNSTNFIFNYGCCGYNNGRNLYSMNCGGFGGGFWNGALFAIGNFAANLCSFAMCMPFMNFMPQMSFFNGGFPFMSQMSPYGGYQYSPSAGDGAGSRRSDNVETLARVETAADRAKKEIEDKIAELTKKSDLSAADLNELINTLKSKKVTIGDDAYNKYLKQIYQLAKTKDIKGLNDPDGAEITDIDEAIAALEPEPVVTDENITALKELGFNETEAQELNTLGVKVITNVAYNKPETKCLTLPSILNKANLTRLVTLIGDKSIPIAAAHNKKAGVEDPWIAGKIDLNSIEELATGELKFKIDCAGVGKKGDTYTIKQKAPNSTKYVAQNSTGTIGKEYTFENGEMWRNGPPNFSSK